MALPDSLSLYNGSTLVLHHPTSLYFTLLDSNIAIYIHTSFYFSLPWLYVILLRSTVALPDSTSLYNGSTSL